MSNRWRLVFIVFALCLIGSSTFLIWKYFGANRTTRVASITTGNDDLALVSSNEVTDPISARSQYIAERLIRGYIQSYDKENQTLNIRYQINERSKEQIIHYPLFLQQTVYCWPQYNNGVDISLAFMPIDPNSLIYIKGEEAVLFENIADQIVGKYVFLQTNEQEELLKLAIVACYD